MSLSESIAIRNNIKIAWETDFKNNYKPAAEYIAKRFVKSCFKDIAESVKNPYLNLYTSKDKYVKSLDFDITDRYDGKKIRIYLTDSKLPPFIEWLEVLNKDNDRYDEKYFCKLMEMVRKAAEPFLKGVCQEFIASCPIEGNKLNFEATYNKSFSLSLSLWFDSESLPYQSPLLTDQEEGKKEASKVN